MTAVLLRRWRWAVLVGAGITRHDQITSGKMLFTSGTRFSNYSQPDQPRSCRRCTPNRTLTTTSATNRKSPSDAADDRPLVDSALTSPMANQCEDAHDRQRHQRRAPSSRPDNAERPIRPSTLNSLSAAYAGRFHRRWHAAVHKGRSGFGHGSGAVSWTSSRLSSMAVSASMRASIPAFFSA